MMNSKTKTLVSGLLWVSAWIATAAHAVNDLPGGPAVRQLNMHPPVTKIAEDQHYLHWLMFLHGVMIYNISYQVTFYGWCKLMSI